MASFTPELHNPSWTPPPPPPKSGSHETSGIGTPIPSTPYGAVGAPPPPPPPPPPGPPSAAPTATMPPPQLPQPANIPDPGDNWLPQLLQDKSKQDIAALLSNPSLLEALTHAPAAIHPSLAASHEALGTALADNVDLATHVAALEARLAAQRASVQAQLLATHALERQWRQKQSEMDHALAPFAPARLYQRLAQGVQEQAAVCHAMEESFLDAGGDAGGVDGRGALAAGADGVPATEREVSDWIRRYREARVQYYLRHERKERWDEGRVGGWR